jgi:hypothetical protein
MAVDFRDGDFLFNGKADGMPSEGADVEDAVFTDV